MTKGTFLIGLMVYAAAGAAHTLNNVQDSSELGRGRVDLRASVPDLPHLRNAWDATFLIYVTKPNGRAEYATAFAVFATPGARGGHRLQLVTADHALGSACDDKRCRGVEVHANGRVARDPRTDDRQFVSRPLDAKTLIVLKRDAAHDLALIEIEADASVDVATLMIAKTAPAVGDAAWLVGYPNVFAGRTDLVADQANLLTRRWSEGRVIGRGTYDARGVLTASAAATDLTVTSIPAKAGNSGGPLINARGAVIGVLAWAATVDGAAQASATVNLADLRDFLELDRGRLAVW